MDRDAHKPVRVVFLTSSYPRTRDDTASVFLRYLAEHLHKLNVNIHVLAPADIQNIETDDDEICIHRFRYFPRRWQTLAYGSGILSNLKRNPLLYFQVPFFVIAMTYALIRHIRKYQPQIIHAHWVIPQGIIAILAKYLYGVPVIITAHGADVFALRQHLFQRIKRFCLRRCDAWTSNTYMTANSVSLDSLPPPQVIPMGVDVEHFASGKREALRHDVADNEKIILFVGRLVEKKGVDDLLKAFALLRHDMRNTASLWIVGDGERDQQLRKSAADLRISDKIKFWGTIPNNNLPDYYAAADIFVGPSVEASSGDTEGQGVVFLEAFAARLSVIATSVGGIPNVIKHGRTGILVEPRNPEKLALAIEHLLQNDNLRHEIAENAHQEAKKSYDWEKIAQDFVKLYRRVSLKQ